MVKSKKKIKKNQKSNICFDLPDRLIIITLLILLVIGFFLRISNVGELSLWVDEYVHVLRAKGVVEGTGSLFTNDNNGILYTIFIIPLFGIFKCSEFWARFPSVILGTGAIYLIYLLGKKLFNKTIGIVSSVILTFSLYNVYWSRVSRNYAIFLFFYLLVLLFFVKGFEKQKRTDATNLFEKNGINLKYLALFVIAFVLSLLSHQLTFLFIFGVSVYFICGEILCIFNKKEHNYKNKYFILSIVSALGLLLIFLPFASNFVKGILGAFLPDRIVTWVIPNWDQLAQYYEKTPYKTFNIYFDVLKNDFSKFYWLGILGIPASFFINRKGGAFIFSMFVVPFVLMSFVFKDPSLPRYLIFIYPLFIIAVAAFLFFITELFIKSTSSFNKTKYLLITFILPIIFVLFFVRYNNLGAIVKAEKKQGYIVDQNLSNWSFTNWKYPSQYVKTNMKDGDLVLSTVTSATCYYAGIDKCIQFRQRHYDTKEKRYKNYEPHKSAMPNAFSYEDIQDILANYDRGWLLADYYFYNVMTDPRARSLVCRYMDYHPQGTKDGSVLVFSWNKKNPAPVKNQTMVYVLGKSESRLVSDELRMNLNKEATKANNLILYSVARSVSPNEMLIVVNNKYKIPFPATKTQDQMEILSVKLKPGVLREGINTFRFVYNKKVKKDLVKGFSVHNLGITTQK